MLKPSCVCAAISLRYSRFFKTTVSTYQPTLGLPPAVNNSAFLAPQWIALHQTDNFLSSKPNESSKELVEVKPQGDLVEPFDWKKHKLRDLTGRQVLRTLFPYKKMILRAKLLDAVVLLYEELADEVNTEEFFDVFKMPDTFASWFIVIEMHVYMMSARIMKEESCGLAARDMLTDSFWNDVIHRSHKLGPRASVLRKKQLMILANQFQAAFYGYDEGIQSNDMVLAAIIWRRFFGFNCDDATQLERLVKYMRIQLHYLTTIPFDDLVYKRPQLIVPLSEVTI